MKLLYIVSLLTLCTCDGCILGPDMYAAPRDWKYDTYGGATVTVERQNELGMMDTFEINGVVSKAVNGAVTVLHLDRYTTYTITEPREKIIKLEDENG